MKIRMRSLAFTVLAVACVCVSFIACESARTTASGMETVAYLQISGDTGRYGTVTVVLDGKDSFEAEVNDIQQRAVKNEYSYKIAVGAHDIEVLSGGNVILKKKIFASANQVKIVEVP